MIGKSWLKTGILLEWMGVISMNIAFWKLLPFWIWWWNGLI